MSTGNISRGSSSTIGLQTTSPLRVRREPGGHGRLPHSAHVRLLQRCQLGADHGPCYEGEAPERVLVYGAVNPLDTRDALEQNRYQVEEPGVDGIQAVFGELIRRQGHWLAHGRCELRLPALRSTARTRRCASFLCVDSRGSQRLLRETWRRMSPIP
jgi:hypothetical protein